MGHHQAVPSLVECVDVLEAEIVHPRQQLPTIRHLRWHGFAYDTVAANHALWNRTVGMNNDPAEMRIVRQHIGRCSTVVFTASTSLLKELNSPPVRAERFSLEHLYDRHYGGFCERAEDNYQRRLLQLRSGLLCAGIELSGAVEYIAAIPDIPAEYANKYRQI